MNYETLYCTAAKGKMEGDRLIHLYDCIDLLITTEQEFKHLYRLFPFLTAKVLSMNISGKRFLS